MYCLLYSLYFSDLETDISERILLSLLFKVSNFKLDSVRLELRVWNFVNNVTDINQFYSSICNIFRHLNCMMCL